METKFTKGEWKFTEHQSGDRTHTVRRIDSNGVSICIIRTNNQIQAEANAKLIAAAPELLEALIEAEKFIKEVLPLVRKQMNLRLESDDIKNQSDYNRIADEIKALKLEDSILIKKVSNAIKKATE